MNSKTMRSPESSYVHRELENLKTSGYAELRSRIGTTPLDIPSELEGFYDAVLKISEDKRKWLTVIVSVKLPFDGQHQRPSYLSKYDVENVVKTISIGCQAGFTITPKGKIFPDYDEPA